MAEAVVAVAVVAAARDAALRCKMRLWWHSVNMYALIWRAGDYFKFVRRSRRMLPFRRS
jgi:hypothetical protein